MDTDHNLKDFQRATVDYVFERFSSNENPCSRFLVADEVGLGKTLVARGVIKKFYTDFKQNGKSELKVIYICSNQNIASQNISRLNIEKRTGNTPQQINRINDLAVLSPSENSFLKITALSPNTSFKISGGGGIVKERAILYNILISHPLFSGSKDELNDLLQLDVGWDHWQYKIQEVAHVLRKDIADQFNSMLTKEKDAVKDLINLCKQELSSIDRRRLRKLIGKLRMFLASICVEYLKPDLIILDEFQRFKYLIDNGNEELTLITKHLFFEDKIKILLLSATPYKMYSIQSEVQEGDNHFEEFRFIVEFLLKDNEQIESFNRFWERYSNSLLHVHKSNWDLIKQEKAQVESLLRSVIARTERISVSEDKNTLLKPSPRTTIVIESSDIGSFISADSVATLISEVSSPIEYCKSCAYPFSFMEGYQLQRLTQKEIENKNTDVIEAIKRNRESFLPALKMNDYAPLESSNAKLTYLLSDSLYAGGSDLLWIPPSLPYYKLEGPFRDKETYSKTLVFSSWVMVPKMIAALSSYECERLTIGNKDAIGNAEERSERKYFQTGSERHPKARLRFRVEGNNYATLSHYALLYPCVSLSKLWSPTPNDGSFEPALKTVNRNSNFN